jgi:hypothetical protein
MSQSLAAMHPVLLTAAQSDSHYPRSWPTSCGKQVTAWMHCMATRSSTLETRLQLGCVISIINSALETRLPIKLIRVIRVRGSLGLLGLLGLLFVNAPRRSLARNTAFQHASWVIGERFKEGLLSYFSSVSLFFPRFCHFSNQKHCQKPRLNT